MSRRRSSQGMPRATLGGPVFPPNYMSPPVLADGIRYCGDCGMPEPEHLRACPQEEDR